MSPVPEPILDLRSDTVTRPTSAMRRAMAEAEVGDDVLGDDPTVLELEEYSAGLLGKDAGLFVASGTMGNLVSLMAQVARGAEIIAPAESHVRNDEAVNYAVVVGAGLRSIAETPDGEMPIVAVLDAIRDDSDPHSAQTGLVVVENAHAHTMNRPIGPAYLRDLRAAVPAAVPIHVDGARLFHSAVALGLPAADLLVEAESASVCLSKGLGAPVGSVVVGSRDLIHRARRARKLLGGGMRQAGIVAAAGLVALRDHVERLADDHALARDLAERLADLPGITSPGHLAQPVPGRLDPGRVTTNVVLFAVEGGRARRTAFLAALHHEGVWMTAYPHGQVRAAAHLDIRPADLPRIVDATARALAASTQVASTQPGSDSAAAAAKASSTPTA